MYEPQPADIALPPTVSIELTHLFPVLGGASMPPTETPTRHNEGHDPYPATVPIIAIAGV